MNEPHPIGGRQSAKRQIRIVHVITRLLQGGAEENTIATCLFQARRGCHVTLIHGQEHHPSWAASLLGQIDLVCLPTLAHPISPFRDLKAIHDLRRLYKNLHPDVVHTHQSKAGIVGRLSAAFARVPIIVHTIHIAPFVNVTGIRRTFFIAAEKACAKITDLLIPVSRGMLDAFVERGIGGQAHFEVIHSGMNLASFATAKAPVEWQRRIGGWPGAERPKLILVLAAFESRKRHRELLHAIAPALQSRPEVCLLLAGDGAERTRCEADAHALNIQSQVRFLGHDSNPHELIALADVCLLTSEREGLPRSAVQSIAGGKPLVISALPGIEELLVHGENGIVTDPHDFAKMVADLFKLLDDPAKVARLSHGARSTDVSRWSEEVMGQRIEAAYRVAAMPEAAAHGACSHPVRISGIELFGLPGAGKTTLAREILKLLQRENRCFAFSGDVMGDDLPLRRRSLRRLGLVARELAWHPRLAFRSVRRLVAKPRRLKDQVKSIWNYCSVLAMCLRHSRRGREMLVLDQGLVQAIWTGRMHREGDGEHLQVASLIDPNWFDECLFVHVKASKQVARTRLGQRERKTSQLQLSDPAGLQTLWSKGDRITSQLRIQVEHELNRRSLQNRLIEVSSDGQHSPRQLARFILARLRSAEADVPMGQVDAAPAMTTIA